MEQKIGNNGLPANAYKELAPGEEYQPVMSPTKVFPEVNAWSVVWGLLMAIIFSAATAYSGLKIGQVFEAAIPIAIIAVGASTAFRRKNALGENVIIQSIGASSGVIVAGAVFTIPALYILQLEVDFFKIFFASLFGGFLGILFLIPFRKYFVRDMHGKLPFPEATATTEILITGEKGGPQAGVLIVSGLIGGFYDLMFSFFKFWEHMFTSKILPIGETIADKYKILFKLDISAMIFGFGYLIGLKFATIITAGSLLSWFVLVPLMNFVGDLSAGAGGVNPMASMSADMIFSEYVRLIGIGAIAMAGIIGIVKSSSVIGSAFKLAVAGFTGGKKKADEGDGPRTDKDLKMTFILMFSALTIIAVFIFLVLGIDITIGQAIAALLTVVIISFLFTTVAANAIAIVGSNPVSGMTLMTLILSSFILVQVGLKGEEGMFSALIIGGIVCTALSMAGGFVTDLKIGYWLGSSPYKQESWKFLGALVSAATVGVVIHILNEAYGFIPDAAHPDAMVAPQANAMAKVIFSFMGDEAIPWMLYLIGAVIALLANALGISPLAFALGMYLPLHLNTPLVVGGFLAHLVQKSSKDKELVQARHQRGTLITSGFIAGAALFGVLGALLTVLGNEFNWNLKGTFNWWAEGSTTPEILAIVMFLALVAYTAWDSMRAKVNK